MRLAFLGPVGTFGEQAAITLMRHEGRRDVDLVPRTGIRAVVEALVARECDAAVVPVENSVEGGVTASLDALWQHRELCIRRAVVLPIRHALLSSGSLETVSEVLSHPQALAQCSGWLAEHLPGALQLPTSSTAEAARMVAGSRFRAAIASPLAGEERGLQQLAFPINDVAGNCTRFLLLERGERRYEGHLASLAFSLHSNRPGALLEALAVFADRGLNMSRIESRPSKRELGEYIFFVDLELGDHRDHQAGQVAVRDLLDALSRACETVSCFGVYSTLDLSDQPEADATGA
ncbi:prephenate dehydratase [Synechococcus sp. RSCCF101]|uniref:prephenate dehydratase n=1 Tax=Synechococcus sp. RSCCF101 TaxID=2511069 RepID=UPI0012493C14|nr:prephenate dehydratase [Synechococcus sp. RSCCF101]QEY32228.1 prephenate dehydratase [Synechococcus sp. RSCCF101]